MTTKIRRAAGTQTFSDLLLSALRLRRRTSETDLAELRAGGTLQVSCFSTTLGTVKLMPVGKGRTIPRLNVGDLQLSTGQALWRNRRTAETVALRGPFDLTPSETRSGHWKIARYDLLTADGPHTISIPKVDVPLVTQVLAAIEN